MLKLTEIQTKGGLHVGIIALNDELFDFREKCGKGIKIRQMRAIVGFAEN